MHELQKQHIRIAAIQETDTPSDIAYARYGHRAITATERKPIERTPIQICAMEELRFLYMRNYIATSRKLNALAAASLKSPSLARKQQRQ